MDLGLSGKVALVTGASRGIGSAIAAELAKEGCSVILVAMNQELLARNIDQIKAAGGKASGFSCDLRDASAVDAMLQKALTGVGAVDILVANAGTAKMGRFLEFTDRDWEEGFATKFFGHMRLIRSLWPSLKAQKGSLIVIAGSAGRTPAETSSITGSVNSALLNLTKSLAVLGAADRVRVNAINPGAIKTDRYADRILKAIKETGKSPEEIERHMAEERGNAPVGDPKDVADLVCFLASKRSKHLQGAIIDIDGGKTRTL